MVSSSGIRRWRRFAALAFALYAVFLVTAQFEHHDLACHLKTPQHCTSCNASPLGSAPKTALALTAFHLHDAGSAVAAYSLAESVVLPAARSGRSPPSFS